MNEQVRVAKRAPALERILTLELVRVTEGAAVAAARLRGRGDEIAADQAAVDAMRRELNRLPVHGTIVVGEGDRDQAPMLFNGEEIGSRDAPRVDIAVDPLEGKTVCAKDLPDAISAIAIAEQGSLLNAPGAYMEKIAIGPGYPAGIVQLEAPPGDNVHALAKAKGVPVGEITACVLDRPRHARLIEELRAAGAAVRLIGDGDIAGIIHTTAPGETGIDIYLGIGGAPEGVLAAAALRCIGGQMQGRLVHGSDERGGRGRRQAGGGDSRRIYDVSELARGDVLFAATGVTDGGLLSGVRFGPRSIGTHTVVMRSSSGTIRWIKADHQDLDKFEADGD
jgi:fructose-1,6-bisphosphatase II / sedoheptulose-1,7-bisphosphatase